MHGAISLTPAWGMSLATIGRVLDLLSTWWVTPKLELEGNPLVKRFGWKFATAWSLLFPLLGYCAPGPGIMIGACSCLMAFSNMHVAFVARYAPGGRHALRALNAKAMKECGLGQFLSASGMLVLPAVMLGLMVVATVGNDGASPATYVGGGILLWSAVILCLRIVNRLRFQRALLREGVLA